MCVGRLLQLRCVGLEDAVSLKRWQSGRNVEAAIEVAAGRYLLSSFAAAKVILAVEVTATAATQR